MTFEDRPTLIYYVQTVLNTFKRSEEAGYESRDRQYAIELLEKAMECQNDIWNAAIDAAIRCAESNGKILLGFEIRKLKK
jgi:3-dehydroquinate dehydratase